MYGEKVGESVCQSVFYRRRGVVSWKLKGWRDLKRCSWRSKNRFVIKLDSEFQVLRPRIISVKGNLCFALLYLTADLGSEVQKGETRTRESQRRSGKRESKVWEGCLTPGKKNMQETWKCAPKILMWLTMLGPKTTRLSLRMPQSLTSPIIATLRPLSPGVPRKLLTLMPTP